MSEQVAALFVQAEGCYSDLPNVDPWPESRDARKYDGPWPVVAHPPCQRWCSLAYLVRARYGYQIGDDGGCFESALASVRRWGGVLEHPAYSIAWKHFGLVRPRRGGWLRAGENEWVAQVSQVAYGHRARKRTWLLCVSRERPADLDWSEPPATAQISGCKNKSNSPRLQLSERLASATPPLFRDALLSIVRACVP